MKAANKLVEKALEPLPLGSIRPGGWLLHQLRIQAEGLTGHLDEFWPDVAESGWIGGTAEGWERGPYWLDGLVPLAFLLDDENQYDQQVNQVICAVSEDPIYTTNGPDANIFGLEPNFGCCTANMHQGLFIFAVEKAPLN